MNKLGQARNSRPPRGVGWVHSDEKVDSHQLEKTNSHIWASNRVSCKGVCMVASKNKHSHSPSGFAVGLFVQALSQHLLRSIKFALIVENQDR